MKLIRSISLLALASATLSAHASVVNYTNLSAWAAATSYTTIAFTGLADGTTLTNQYVSQGVTFDGTDAVSSNSSFTLDGQGVNANGTLDLSFSSAINAFATTFPGAARYSLFQGTTLVGTSDDFGGVGLGFFGGVVSTIAFDRVVLSDFVDGAAYADNVYFSPIRVSSTPGPVAALPFALVALRRRKKA